MHLPLTKYTIFRCSVCDCWWLWDWEVMGSHKTCIIWDKGIQMFL